MARPLLPVNIFLGFDFDSDLLPQPVSTAIIYIISNIVGLLTLI